MLLYPYLVHWIDKYIFDVYNFNKDIIAKIANDLYRIGIKKKNYEACSFALYWSIKYKFRINDEFPEQSILSEDCIFLLLSYLKSKNECDKDSMNLLKTHALSLKDAIETCIDYLHGTNINVISLFRSVENIVSLISTKAKRNHNANSVFYEIRSVGIKYPELFEAMELALRLRESNRDLFLNVLNSIEHNEMLITA